MSKLDCEIKVRAPVGLKSRLRRIARKRFLEMSDVVREALRDYADAAEKSRKKAA